MTFLPRSAAGSHAGARAVCAGCTKTGRTNEEDIAAAQDKSVELVFSDGSPSVTPSVHAGAMGPEAIDISTFYKQTGKFTDDPGFLSTASCRSAITYIEGAAGKLLYRVYKNDDPRAKLMRETCHEVLDAPGLHDPPVFKLALALEKIALEDDYFVEPHLDPNVDFYSRIVQKAVGIPTPLLTAVFAPARTVGRFARLNEMIDDPAYRIGRSRQLFDGHVERHAAPLEQRRGQRSPSATVHLSRRS